MRGEKAKESDKAAFCVAGKNIARKNVPLMYSIAARHARAIPEHKLSGKSPAGI